MIAVVKEKDDFSANFLLEMSSGQNFGNQISFRKKSARLLAETNNRLMHGQERASYPGRSFRAAEQSLLQDWRDDQYGRASNKVVPQVTDVRCYEQEKHEHLCKERRKKYRGSRNSTNKESRQEKAEDTAIKD